MKSVIFRGEPYSICQRNGDLYEVKFYIPWRLKPLYWWTFFKLWLKEPYLPAAVAYPFWSAVYAVKFYVRDVLPLDLKIGAALVRAFARRVLAWQA